MTRFLFHRQRGSVSPSRNLISIALWSLHERRACQLQCPSHGAVVGESRSAARQAAATGAAPDARGAPTQPLLDLGLLREVSTPHTDGASAANNSMGRRDIE
jgi:hypothetical protein